MLEYSDNPKEVNVPLLDIWIPHVDCLNTPTNAVVTTQTQAFSKENERPTNPPKRR